MPAVVVSAPGDVRYARTSDGIDIAYLTFGEGESELMLAGFVTHLDLQWDFRWFQMFAAPWRGGSA